MMNRFLAPGAQEVSSSFLSLLVDRAGWHTTPQGMGPEDRRLLPQPARSPELNPTEHVWEEPREKERANKSFPALRPLEHALCTGLSALAADPKRGQSLTDFPYLPGTF